jgi:hypothetical protein
MKWVNWVWKDSYDNKYKKHDRSHDIGSHSLFALECNHSRYNDWKKIHERKSVSPSQKAHNGNHGYDLKSIQNLRNVQVATFVYEIAYGNHNNASESYHALHVISQEEIQDRKRR